MMLNKNHANNFFKMKNLIICFCLALCISCNTKKNNEDFETFYDRFHSDTVFQLERIQFPLPKNSISSVDRIPKDIADQLNIFESNKDQENYWTKENWIFHKKIELDTLLYKKEMIKTDGLICERIYINASGFDFKRCFKLIDNKWVLFYVYESNF